MWGDDLDLLFTLLWFEAFMTNTLSCWLCWILNDPFSWLFTHCPPHTLVTSSSLLHHCLSFCTSLIWSLGSAVSIAVSNVGYTRGILKRQSEPSLSLKQDNFTHVTQRDRLTCKLICSIHTLTPLTVCCWLSTATVYFWQWASCSVRKH